MAFSHLGLSDKVLAAIESAGYTSPTPIQDQAIPHVLAAPRRARHRPDRHRQDRRLRAADVDDAGTGPRPRAHAAHADPRADARTRRPGRRAFEKYGKNHKLNVALIIGGVSFDDQDAKLIRGVDVLIATPGRLLDHSERGRLLLSGVELLVIDEADRMLDMGFIPDIERICKLVPFTRQTLFFSATMPPEIQRITDSSCTIRCASKSPGPPPPPPPSPSCWSRPAAIRPTSARRCAA